MSTDTEVVAYNRGKSDYQRVMSKTDGAVEGGCPFPLESFSAVMWSLGYEYMRELHSLEK